MQSKPALKLGRVIRVTFSPVQPGLQITRVWPRLDHVRNEIVRLTTWKLMNASRVALS